MLSIEEATKALERLVDKNKVDRLLHTAAIITDLHRNITPRLKHKGATSKVEILLRRLLVYIIGRT